MNGVFVSFSPSIYALLPQEQILRVVMLVNRAQQGGLLKKLSEVKNGPRLFRRLYKKAVIGEWPTFLAFFNVMEEPLSKGHSLYSGFLVISENLQTSQSPTSSQASLPPCQPRPPQLEPIRQIAFRKQ